MRVPIHEALRYLGIHAPDEAALSLARSQAELLESRVTPRFVWKMCSLEKRPDGWELKEAGFCLPGALADRMLADCDRAALLLCTLGAGFDALLRTVQARDMAKAAVLDACGSAWIEACCGEAEEEIAARYPGLFLTDRFSPGYGDLPLALQGDWLKALDGEKRLGVTENAAHLLVPVKSVTAAVGLSPAPQPARIRGCAFCALAGECAYRERGLFCGS